jgi:hypothetical protein
MTTDNSNPVSGRRAVYAAVALADLPMPVRISFETDGAEFRLVFDSIAAFTAWADELGVERVYTRHNDDGEDVASGFTRFVGRPVWLCGRQPASPASVPETLPAGSARARLEQLAQEAA